MLGTIITQLAGGLSCVLGGIGAFLNGLLLIRGVPQPHWEGSGTAVPEPSQTAFCNRCQPRPAATSADRRTWHLAPSAGFAGPHSRPRLRRSRLALSRLAQAARLRARPRAPA
jgi:hypothetical protein